MKKTKILMMAAMLALAASLVVGCGGGADSGSGSTGGADSGSDVTLNFIAHGPLTQSVFTSDPAVDYSGQFNQVNGTCETLFTLDEATKEVQPLLAESIEQADDTTWVVTIKDGITFSNGKALDAAAVKAAFDYILEVNTRLATLMDVASIEADGQTLTIKTNDVVAIMPRILTEQNMYVFDTDDDDYANGLVGTGPYVIESMATDGTADLVRNDNYWQGTPAAARLHTLPITDETAASNALQSGELDWAKVAASDLPLYEGNDAYKVEKVNYGRVYYLYLNPNYTFTQDDALREAITYAIDREGITSGVYNGGGVATRSIFPEGSKFYTADALQPEYDAEKAKQILADAGYADSDGDGIVEKDGENVVLNITCYEANNFKTLSEVIQSMLQSVGIGSEIVVSDTIYDDLTAGKFNIGTYGYNVQTMGDAYNYIQPVFETAAGSNFTKFSDPDVDAAIAQLRVTTDDAKRAELVQGMQQAIYDSNERLYIMHTLDCMVSHAEVQNVSPLYGTDNADYSKLWEISK